MKKLQIFTFIVFAISQEAQGQIDQWKILVEQSFTHYRAENHDLAIDAARKALAIAEMDTGPNSEAIALNLKMIANSYRAKWRWIEAEPLFLRAMNMYAHVSGTDHPDVATVASSLGRGYITNRQADLAEPLLKRALAIREKTFPSTDPKVISSQNDLADLYESLGRHSEAEALYKNVLARLEKVRGKNDPEVAFALKNLGMLYRRLGRYSEGINLVSRGLAISEMALGLEHSDVAISLNALASLYEDLGQYSLAETLYLRSLKIREKLFGLEHTEVAKILNNLGLLYYSQSRYAEAEQLYNRSLAIEEKASGFEHPQVATSLNNIALLLHTIGQYTQAEPLYIRSLKIRERAYGQDHRDVAGSLHNLARLYATLGRYDEAERFQSRSLRVWEKLLGPEHPDVATGLDSLASLHTELGHYAQVEPYLLRSVAIREKALGSEHPDVAASLNNLALHYHNQGRTTLAEQAYKRALLIQRKILGPHHSDVATTLSNLSWFYITQNRLTSGLDTIRQSTDILAKRTQTSAENIASPRINEHAGRAITFAVHASLIGKLLPAANDRPKLIAEAFAIAQHARMGDTGAALAQMAARASAGSGVLSQMMREQQDAVAAWRQFDKQLIDALGKPAHQRNASAEQALRQRLAVTDARITTLNAELQRDFPEYRELISPEPLAVDDAQQLLGPDEALLSYLVTSKETLLWIIRPGGAEMIRLEVGSEALGKQVAMLRQGVDIFDGLPDFPHAAAYALYQSVFAPAVPHLAGAKHVMVVADGPLQSLPFGILLSAELPPKAEKDNPWLIRQYAFTNLPAVTSLRALRRFGKKREATEPFMGFGDPMFRGTREDARSVSVAKLFARGVLADTREVSRMARLPETADELKAIAKTLKAVDNTIRLREAATEQQVKQTNLEPYRVLAFATHGLMSGDFKGLAEPALALTPPEAPSELDDGLLTASEVAGLKLNAEWVILSACNTAAADGKPGAEGFSGLTKAFFYAGSQTLLVSHWAVDSVATVALTTRMFAEAQKGIGRAEALRRSMLALIDHPTDAMMRHPAMWAPFVVVGEGVGTR